MYYYQIVWSHSSGVNVDNFSTDIRIQDTSDEAAQKILEKMGYDWDEEDIIEFFLEVNLEEFEFLYLR